MPQNEKFMYAAYAVATAAYLLYAATLWLRRRALERREVELDRAISTHGESAT
ncbi:MAG TPA: hypothetical protein VFX39_06770 [Gemmatimonadaceae bacterium]|jgi:hypothetical protein|nr:hypothetical protein [Gemmatimonadaceae bacterium]